MYHPFYKPRHADHTQAPLLALSPVVRRSLVGGTMGIALILGGTAMGPTARPYRAEAQPVTIPVARPLVKPVPPKVEASTPTTTPQVETQKDDPVPVTDRQRDLNTPTRRAAAEEMRRILTTASTRNSGPVTRAVQEDDPDLPPVTTLPDPAPIDPPVIIEPEPQIDEDTGQEPVDPQPDHGEDNEEHGQPPVEAEGEHRGWTDPQPEHGQDTSRHKEDRDHGDAREPSPESERDGDQGPGR